MCICMYGFVFFLFAFCYFFVVFFLRGANCCLLQHRRDGFSLITITAVGVEKP